MATSPRIRPVMKRVNATMTSFAKQVPPWAVIHHVGRKSGKPYSTPVVAFAVREPIHPEATQRPGAPVAIKTTRDVLVVSPLPWGSDVDWCRNALSAGSYTLTRKGTDYQVDELRVVGPEEAKELMGTSGLFATNVLRVKEFVVGRLRPAKREPSV